MFFLEFFQGIYTLTLQEPQVVIGRLVLVALGIFLIWLAYRKILEPLIMLPLGMGLIAVNAGLMVMEAGNIGNLFINPLQSSNFEEIMYFLQIDFLQPVYTFMFTNGLIACLVFMGIGAITDIDILLAKPGMSFFLAMFAELGTIATLPIAIAMGFPNGEAAATALIGGADGPMVLYGSLRMAPELFVPITIVAYVYLGITYAGFPFLAKILPKRMRATEMDWREIPQVSAGKKFTFCIATFTLLAFLFPVATPLFASFFLGLAIKEAKITRFVEFLSGPLLYGSTHGCRYPFRFQGRLAAPARRHRPPAFRTRRPCGRVYLQQDQQETIQSPAGSGGGFLRTHYRQGSPEMRLCREQEGHDIAVCHGTECGRCDHHRYHYRHLHRRGQPGLPRLTTSCRSAMEN